jgi:hypothetical protein
MSPLRWAALAALTVGLGMALSGLDWLVVGAPRARGWVSVEGLAAVPAEAGPVRVPDYVPSRLGWPPSRVRYRVAPDGQGTWIALGEPPAAWIGTWVGAPPDLGPPGACLQTPPDCPPGWRVRARALDAGRLAVLTRLDAEELARIYDSLAPTRGQR